MSDELILLIISILLAVFQQVFHVKFSGSVKEGFARMETKHIEIKDAIVSASIASVSKENSPVKDKAD